MQEAVERLLQNFEAVHAAPDQEIYDKEFFGFTYGNYGRLLSQSFSWLPSSPSSVHPTPAAPIQSASCRQLKGSSGMAATKPPFPARVASALRLNVASTAVAAQRLKLSSKAYPQQQELSVHSTAPLTVGHHLPAKRASILKLNVGSTGTALAPKHSVPNQGLSGLKFDLGNMLSRSVSRASWLPSRENSVQPLLEDTPPPDSAAKGSSQAHTSSNSTLRSRASFSSQPQSDRHTASADAGALQSTMATQITRTKSILRSKSSLTAASLFEAGLSIASSDEDGSLAVPEHLIDSAMFLLRDNTLADPQAEVCNRPLSLTSGCMPVCICFKCNS